MARRRHFLGSAVRRTLSPLAFTASVMVIAATASAHPGHGVTPDGDSAAHYLLEPTHGLGIIAVLAVAANLVILRARGIARRQHS